MICPNCYSENTSDSHYCKKCATPLPSSEKILVSHTETLLTPKKELTSGRMFSGRYQVIEELGKGGMGRVYRVTDTKINEEVALKLINPEIAANEKTIERFSNELKLARKIGHRNVCRMYHIGENEGTHYITQEYVSGENLKRMIRMMGQLSPGKAISIAKQVCEGLTEAHRIGVVHRDLKPQNIMIDKEGNARIMDFGIARSLNAKGITGSGVIVGTPEYMSPEQAEAKDVDQRSDIYSLGVILYEMVTGRVPFDGDTPLSIAMKHKGEIPKDPKELNAQIPEDLSRIILKCMEKDKEKRYQEAGVLLSELKEIEAGIPSTDQLVPERKPSSSKEITVTFNFKELFLPSLAVLALIILAVVISRFLPKEEIIPIPTDKPSLAVMYFKNNTGDESLNHWRSALSDLLITDLSQSKYIKVLSGEKLFNILSQLDQLEANTYSSNVLKEVSTRGGVKNILVGNYTRAEDVFRINVTLQEATTGEVIGSESAEGVGEKDFYPMVDELTRRIKTNFKFSEIEIASDIDKEVGKITTSSPEAYKYYSDGRKYHLIGDYRRSLSAMQKALTIDPDFAMAYRSVAMSYSNMGLKSEKIKALQKAFELKNRTSVKEQYLIEGAFYSGAGKTLDKAIAAYKKILELYPEDSTANINLGVIYFGLEEWDKAFKLLKVNLKNKSVSFIIFWNTADLYMVKGLYDKAREVLDEALKNHPDIVHLYNKLALVYICQGKYDLALTELDKILSFKLDQDQQMHALKLKGDTYLLNGNFSEAEKEYQKFPKGTPTSRMSLAALYLSQGKFEESINQLKLKPVFHEPLAYLYLKSGNPEEALKEHNNLMSKAVKTESFLGQIHSLHFKGLSYLAMKSMNEAQKSAYELKNLIEKGMNKKLIRFYHHLMGMIECERKNFSKSINHLSKAISLLPYPCDIKKDYHTLFINSLAQAYFKAGNIEKAQKEYENIISLTLSRLNDGNMYAESFYMLGKIYEKKGLKRKAVEHYQKFLNLWKDADPGLFEVDDAKKRVSELKSS